MVIGQPCGAGLTPSEVVVVVNGGSLNSRTLANHYVQLRGIPSANVIVLEDVPNSEVIAVEDFRQRILIPLLDQIQQRGLREHVQCVAYSADFPTAIDIKQDLAKLKDLPEIYTPVGSINSLTYLYELTLAGNPAYVTADINYYARRPMETYFSNPAGAAIQAFWQETENLIAEGQHEEAAKRLAALIQQLPHQYPLKYLAAAQAALANLPEVAIKLLEAAISGGWNSGGYLAQDKRFDTLRDRDDFQLLEILLDPDAGKWQPTVGFNSRALWAPNGVRFSAPPDAQAPGMRYLLSVVLGVTRGGGTTLQEAVTSLRRAAAADFTHPGGVFYFSDTSNIRSQTRQPLFAEAVAALSDMGFAAEIIGTTLPRRKPAVLGAQLGAGNFDWSKSGSTLVPGSIADNLTSFGGVMTMPSSQVKLTELIKAGAAGSSGTVTEPFSLAFKFPTPYLYVHYAQGATLAEAFYQSVFGPYQLLIVGDPLCQPFSNAPNLPLDTSPREIEPNGSIRLQPALDGPSYADWSNLPEPRSQRTQPLAPARIAVQIDGFSPRGGPIQPTVDVNFSGIPPGYHEVQVLLIADDPLHQRAQHSIPVWIGPTDLVTLSLNPPAGSLPAEKPPQLALRAGRFSVTVKVPDGCRQASVWHQSEMLAAVEVDGASATSVDIEPRRLGMGPVRLQAKAQREDGTMIASRPMWIDIVP